MNEARDFIAASKAGTSTAALASGGGDGPLFASTEEWYGDGLLREIISSS